jgi:pyruvate/2-oxoglutarate dehydrogenase complex dihydrolipoamide acyltransferase (E2) component
VPGLLVFSLRLLVEALLVPVRGVLRVLGVGDLDADRHEPVGAEAAEAAAPAEPPAPAPPRAARRRPPQRRAAPRRAEPTRGQVAAMREAAREAETGGTDSVGAQVHVAEPWAGYDAMRLDEVLARLEDATEVELAVVRAYEREHEARQAILLAVGEPA